MELFIAIWILCIVINIYYITHQLSIDDYIDYPKTTISYFIIYTIFGPCATICFIICDGFSD